MLDVEQAVMDGMGKASKVSPFSHEPHQVCVQEVDVVSAADLKLARPLVSPAW